MAPFYLVKRKSGIAEKDCNSNQCELSEEKTLIKLPTIYMGYNKDHINYHFHLNLYCVELLFSKIHSGYNII